MSTSSPNQAEQDSGIIFGDIVYWCIVCGTIVTIIGSTLAIIIPNNVIEPGFLFSAIRQGMTSDQIWLQATGEIPHGHWYLTNLTRGDGLTMFGIVTGIISVIPALFATAAVLYKKGEKFFAVLSLLAGICILLPCLGIGPA